ncbi:MAG TPA: phosphoribosylanthranilate isomerase [Opitutae bacterium]|mgnify:CR=1 FL=1|nr:phosphoribosylanthranilate isomerase [Opitutae bacterium]
MANSVTVKICGLTRERDVAHALSLGADLLGFIVYEPSPRGLTVERAQELAALVPIGRRVVVDVAPSIEKLSQCLDAGFDYFQIHLDGSTNEASVAAWSELVGKSRLWLAPRLKPGEVFPEHLLQYAETILVDTYSSEQVGGTGQTGEWGDFARWKTDYSQQQWVLAGGLNAGNITRAIAETGASHLDVNSGVEIRPGVKDHEKLESLFGVCKQSF